MILQVVVENDLMDEARVARPVVLRLRLGEADVEFEIRKIFFNGLELILIEYLTARTRTVPEGDRNVRFLGMEEVENVRAHRGHPRAAADKHLFVRRVAHEKLPVRAGNSDFIAGLDFDTAVFKVAISRHIFAVIRDFDVVPQSVGVGSVGS